MESGLRISLPARRQAFPAFSSRVPPGALGKAPDHPHSPVEKPAHDRDFPAAWHSPASRWLSLLRSAGSHTGSRSADTLLPPLPGSPVRAWALLGPPAQASAASARQTHWRARSTQSPKEPPRAARTAFAKFRFSFRSSSLPRQLLISLARPPRLLHYPPPLHLPQ